MVRVKRCLNPLEITIAPSDVEKQFGAEILRLWVTSVDSSNDVRISMDILSQVSETYRKIRNTLRFLIANTSDFNPAEDAVAYDELRSVDKYMTVRFNQLVKTIRDAYADFEFLTIYKALVNFINVDLSAFYLDFAKDVVYYRRSEIARTPSNANSLLRYSCQDYKTIDTNPSSHCRRNLVIS